MKNLLESKGYQNLLSDIKKLTAIIKDTVDEIKLAEMISQRNKLLDIKSTLNYLGNMSKQEFCQTIEELA